MNENYVLGKVKHIGHFECWLIDSDKFYLSLNKYRVNVSSGINEDRLMMTGMHTVADIFCVKCGSIVGWKYVSYLKTNYMMVCVFLF